MEMVKTLKFIRYYVTYANFIGTIDAKFDSETRTITQVGTRSYWLRYCVTLSLIILIRTVTYALWIRDILSGNFGLTDKFDILHFGMNIVSFYCAGNHFLNFWNRNEIPTTINSFVHFYQRFESKYFYN